MALFLPTIGVAETFSPFLSVDTCNIKRNASFAAMQPFDSAHAASPEECCTAMMANARCNQSGVFVCKYNSAQARKHHSATARGTVGYHKLRHRRVSQTFQK